MEAQFEEYGFYKVNKEYLKFLYSKDVQVFYKEEEGYEKKPHLGLIAQIGTMKYCIPLTSAKTRQLNWANVSKHNLLIHENVNKNELHDNDVCKRIGNTDKYKKILAVLEIRKMVPVDDSLCTYINFDEIQDSSYRDLLEKEYRFLKPYKQTILDKAVKLYERQKETGIIESCYCNFNILEDAYKEFVAEEVEQASIEESGSEEEHSNSESVPCSDIDVKDNVIQEQED